MVKPDYNRNKLLLMQYGKWLPAKLGLLNYGAFCLQINEIRASDVFLVSYPKSGNTWLRYIVATALSGKSELSFTELEKLVPDVYVSKTKVNQMGSPRFIKSHHTLFDYYPAAVYIYRDYRDVLVSYYHYALNAKEYNGTFSEFIRSDFPVKSFGSWAAHIKKALAAKSSGKRLLLLSYEGMLQNPVDYIKQILEFCSIKTNLTPERIAESCNFDQLKSTEKNTGSYFGTQELFFRNGKSVAGANISLSDLNFILETPEVRDLMMELGYLR